MLDKPIMAVHIVSGFKRLSPKLIMLNDYSPKVSTAIALSPLLDNGFM